MIFEESCDCWTAAAIYKENLETENPSETESSLSPLQFCCLVSYMLNDPKNWNRSTRILSGCSLIFQGIYLKYEGHISFYSRMQKVVSRNSIAITITLQDCQVTEEIRHTTTYFTNDCFIDLKATTPSQVSLVCLCITKNSYIIFLQLCWFSKYCFTKTQLPSLLKREEMMIYPFLRARIAADGYSYPPNLFQVHSSLMLNWL